MRKIITLLIFLILLLTTVSMASAREEAGDPLWGLLGTSINPITFTIVNNHLCDDYPRKSHDIEDSRFLESGVGGAVIPVNQVSIAGKYSMSIDGRWLKMTNVGVPGMVFQVFEISKFNGAWSRIDESKVLLGGFSQIAIDPDGLYHVDVFYCLSERSVCGDYVSECTQEGKTLRKRYCTDKGGYETMWVDYVDRSAPSCLSESKPSDPTHLSTPSTNEPRTTTSPITQTGQLSGAYTDVIIPTLTKPGSKATITAIFRPTVTGYYYLEAGIDEGSPFAIALSAEGSKCDDSTMFAGDWFNLKAGEEYQIKFTVDTPNKIGEYPLRVGAYSACFDVSATITEKTHKILIANDVSELSSTGIVSSLTQQNLFLLIGAILLVLGWAFSRKRFKRR